MATWNSVAGPANTFWMQCWPVLPKSYGSGTSKQSSSVLNVYSGSRGSTPKTREGTWMLQFWGLTRMMPKELSCQCLVYFGIFILLDEVQPQKAWEGTWMLQFWGWTRMMPKELSCQCLVYFEIFILLDEVQPQKHEKEPECCNFGV